MSSDTIKQIASRILSTIKNQYPNNYTDPKNKELLVKNILKKIDNYSTQIRPNTIQRITQIIINEIISENNTRVNQYQNQSFNNLSNAQFERNNMINNNRPIGISQRSQPTSTKNSNQNSNRQVKNNFDDNSIPIDNKYEQMLQARQQEMTQSRQRPTTPDFSLDGSGKKKQ